MQETAPAPRTTSDDIIAKAGRIRARRTATAIAGGVAACVALMATTVIGLRPHSNDLQQGAPPAASPTQPTPTTSTGARVSAGPPIQPTGFSTDLGEYRVGAYKVGPAGQVAPGYQEIPVYRNGATLRADDGTYYPLAEATITVYRPGVYDPTTFGGPGNATLVIGDPYPVSVGGRSGIGRDMMFSSPVDRQQTWVRASLAWQYAPHAWATFIPNYDTVALPRADAVKVAAGLVTGHQRELSVPYRLGFLPAGWLPVAVTQTPGKLSSEVSKVFLHRGPLTESAATRIDEVFPHSALITVFKGKPKDLVTRGTARLHCYAGRAECDIIQGDYLIDVADWNGSLSDDAVRQITEGLQLLDPADQKTWVPVQG